MSPTILGSTGTGPIVDRDGKPLRALNQFAGPDGGAPDGQDDSPGSTPPASPARRRRLTSRRSVQIVGATLVPITLLVAWHLLTAVTGTFASYQLPSPEAVWAAGVELAENGVLWQHIAISTQRVLLGFALGAVVGLVVGAVVGLSRVADILLVGTVGAARAVPSLAWVPLLILWMGINEDSKVLLIAIGAFFPVYTTVASALHHVDRHLVEVGRAYGMRGAVLLGRVQLPAATPSVISGLRLAMAQAWLFLVAAELIASSMGLGFLLTDSQNNGRVDRILLAIITLAVLGKLTDTLIGLVEKRLARRW